MSKQSAPKPATPAAREGERRAVELLQGLPAKSVRQLETANGTEKYSGETDSERQRHGRGVLRWANGNVYAGEWREGFMDGSGYFFYNTEGDTYDGAFARDKKHGSGMYTFANGNHYEGEFGDDKRHGTGRYKWTCGDEYDGEWRDGHMHGTGRTVYANGNRYNGCFVEDRREGFGRLECTDGLAYEGVWLGNNRHGHGRLTFPSGDFYDGEWAEDRKHGQGRELFSSGNEYTGAYVDNAKTGAGVMKYANGDRYEGEFDSNEMHGHGVYRFANGFVYDGEWAHDFRSGYGVYTFPNGHVYKGHWAHDRRHGDGVLILSTTPTAPGDLNAGEAYVGTWHEGKMHGRFQVFAPPMDDDEERGPLTYEGDWRQGSPAGRAVYYVALPADLGALFPPASGEDAVPPALAFEGEWSDTAHAPQKGSGTVEPLPAAVREMALQAARDLLRVAPPVGPGRGALSPKSAGAASALSAATAPNRGGASSLLMPLPLFGDVMAMVPPAAAAPFEPVLRPHLAPVAGSVAALADQAAPLPGSVEALRAYASAHYAPVADASDDSETPATALADMATRLEDTLHSRLIPTVTAAANGLRDAHTGLVAATAALGCGPVATTTKASSKAAKASADGDPEALRAVLEAAALHLAETKAKAEEDAAATRAAQDRTAAAKARIAAARRQAEAANKAAGSAAANVERYESLQRLVDEGRRKLETAEAEAAQAERDVAQLRGGRLRELDELSQAAAGDLSDLKAKAKAAEDAARRSQAAVADESKAGQERLTKAKAALARLHAQIQETEKAAAEREAAAADRAAQQEAATRAAVEARRSELEQELATALEEQTRLEGDLAAKEADIDAKDAALGSAEAVIASRAAEIEHSTRALAAAEAERDAAEEGLRREQLAALRRQQDRELAAAEADVAAVQQRVLQERTRRIALEGQRGDTPSTGSEASAPAPATSGGAAGRLRRLSHARPLDDGELASLEARAAAAEAELEAAQRSLAEAEEAVRLMRKKEAKRAAKVQDLGRGAGAQADSDAEELSGLVAAAKKEALVNQLAKLRQAFDAASKEKDSAQSALDAAKAALADGDDAASDDEAAAEARFLRDVVHTIEAEEKDWRLNDMAQKYQQRQRQIDELRGQAHAAQLLEDQLREVNQAIADASAKSQGPATPVQDAMAMGPVTPQTTTAKAQFAQQLHQFRAWN